MRVHFIAIGGSVMHNLAIWLHKNGDLVSGSDDKVFGVARQKLEEHHLLPTEMGWHPDRISSDLDVVILGMHARADNPELARAKELGLTVMSFPEFVFEQCRQKQRVVVCGSHGKTSISAMIIHVLSSVGKSIDYVIGAPVEGVEGTVKLTKDNPLVIIEGDEYPSSAIDMQPKFMHYHHHIAVVSGIAWDHVNVYPEEKGYVGLFQNLMERTPKAGTLAFYEGDKRLGSLVKKSSIRTDIFLKPYTKLPATIKNGVTYLKSKNSGSVPLKIFGSHNLQNLAAAWQVCSQLGVSEEKFMAAVETFKGAKLRMELVEEGSNVTVFRDFAHAPSKLKASVKALATQFKDKHLYACMELHTFSSLNKEFMAHYDQTMANADVAIVYYDPEVVAAKKIPPISPADVIKAFGRNDLKVFTTTEELLGFLTAQSWHQAVLALMSSGGFGGLDIQALVKEIVKDPVPNLNQTN